MPRRCFAKLSSWSATNDMHECCSSIGKALERCWKASQSRSSSQRTCNMDICQHSSFMKTVLISHWIHHCGWYAQGWPLFQNPSMPTGTTTKDSSVAETKKVQSAATGWSCDRNVSFMAVNNHSPLELEKQDDDQAGSQRICNHCVPSSNSWRYQVQINHTWCPCRTIDAGWTPIPLRHRFNPGARRCRPF